MMWMMKKRSDALIYALKHVEGQGWLSVSRNIVVNSHGYQYID